MNQHSTILAIHLLISSYGVLMQKQWAPRSIHHTQHELQLQHRRLRPALVCPELDKHVLCFHTDLASRWLQSPLTKTSRLCPPAEWTKSVGKSLSLYIYIYIWYMCVYVLKIRGMFYFLYVLAESNLWIVTCVFWYLSLSPLHTFYDLLDILTYFILKCYL